MSAGDLGFWMGIIFSPIPALKVYQAYGLWAGIGTFVASIYILGFLFGMLLSLIFAGKR